MWGTCLLIRIRCFLFPWLLLVSKRALAPASVFACYALARLLGEHLFPVPAQKSGSRMERVGRMGSGRPEGSAG